MEQEVARAARAPASGLSYGEALMWLPEEGAAHEPQQEQTQASCLSIIQGAKCLESCGQLQSVTETEKGIGPTHSRGGVLEAHASVPEQAEVGLETHTVRVISWDKSKQHSQ